MDLEWIYAVATQARSDWHTAHCRVNAAAYAWQQTATTRARRHCCHHLDCLRHVLQRCHSSAACVAASAVACAAASCCSSSSFAAASACWSPCHGQQTASSSWICWSVARRGITKCGSGALLSKPNCAAPPTSYSLVRAMPPATTSAAQDECNNRQGNGQQLEADDQAQQ